MYRSSVVLACALGLTACGGSEQAPTGQVVARVNGQEITLSELNAELLANNLSSKAEDKQVRQSILERLIARKLLVETAKEKDLHKNSEFILARQRSEENELAGLAQRAMLNQMKPPTKQEAEKYVKDHPEIFTGRKQMILEQIRFQKPENANDLKFLQGATSLDDVAERLKQNAIRFERVPVVFDTASVSSAVAAQIDKVKPGELFTIANEQMVLISAINEKRPAAIPPEAAVQYAGRLIQQERARKAIQTQVDQVRQKAKITYQPGYEPAKKQS